MARIAAPVLTVAVMLAALAGPAAGDGAKPRRIVSMNQCTDLFVLMLADPERIASISFVTQQKQWTPPEYREVVGRLPSNHGLAEEVLALKPDLVVTTPFTGSAAVRLLGKLGYPVEIFAPETKFDDIRTNILRMGDLLGEHERAQAAVAAFDAASCRTSGARRLARPWVSPISGSMAGWRARTRWRPRSPTRLAIARWVRRWAIPASALCRWSRSLRRRLTCWRRPTHGPNRRPWRPTP